MSARASRHSPAPQSAFRTDIQALRGYAVLIVLLYHAKIGSLTGGFLGVDVFFVLSGFLITGLVKKGIEQKTFRLADFYFRRAKRLLPAAYVTFLLTSLMAPFFLASLELEQFRSQMIGSITFTSNIVLWRQSGYFDGAAALKPLLHVWSLSIEEQYYFILPALMLFIPPRFWRKAALVTLLLSLGLCMIMIHRDPAATFYLLPTRGWELALGSIAALLTIGPLLKKVIALAFWPSITALCLLPFIKLAPYHPGPDALLACIATLFIVLRQHPVLNTGPVIHGMSRLGDLSYSLYLVHWPLFAFMNNAWLGDHTAPLPPVTVRLSLMVLSLLLAWLLNRYIEEPARKLDIGKTRHNLYRTVAASLTLILIPFGITQAVATDRSYAELRKGNHGLSANCDGQDYFRTRQDCRTSDSPQIMVWGDSHAMHLLPGIAASSVQGDSVIQATKSMCGPLLDIAVTNSKYSPLWAEDCIAFNSDVLDYLTQHRSIETVVLSSTFRQYLPPQKTLLAAHEPDATKTVSAGQDVALEGLHKTVNKLRELGKKVVIIAPPPATGLNVGRCLERQFSNLPTWGAPDDCQLDEQSWRTYRKPVLTFLATVPETIGVDVIHLSDYLCKQGLCKTIMNGTALYPDSGHLSQQGSTLVAEKMALLKQIKQRAY